MITIVFLYLYYANSRAILAQGAPRMAVSRLSTPCHDKQRRALDGEPLLEPSSGGIVLHRIERVPLSQASGRQVESFPERRNVCPYSRDPSFLLSRCHGQFDTSAIRGSVNSGASPECFPCLSRLAHQYV